MRLSRRRLLQTSAAGLLAACGGREPELDEFLAVSAAVTGVPRKQLDPGAARAYLLALQTPPAGGLSIAQLAQSGLAGASAAPGSADALRSRGILDLKSAKLTADRIAEYWYRGQIPPTAATGGAANQNTDAKVVTYKDALGWAALTFAAAPATCGGAFGFWGAKPSE